MCVFVPYKWGWGGTYASSLGVHGSKKVKNHWYRTWSCSDAPPSYAIKYSEHWSSLVVLINNSAYVSGHVSVRRCNGCFRHACFRIYLSHNGSCVVVREFPLIFITDVWVIRFQNDSIRLWMNVVLLVDSQELDKLIFIENPLLFSAGEVKT